MTDGYSSHIESVVLARQQANEVISHLFQAKEEAEKLAVMTIQAVGENPVNNAGREALEGAAHVHDAIDPLIQYLEGVKFQLDEYSGMIV